MDVRLVNVEVAVVDAAGRRVPDLARRNFLVKEDGVPQVVTHFAPTTAPIRAVLLVEASPAVFLLQTEHLATAVHLLQRLGAEDEVALLSYARELHAEVPFTRDKRLIGQRLDALGRFGLGMAEMNLNDAIADTLAWLSPEGSPPPRRTAVVVIGTGLDSGSRLSWGALAARVGASQVTIFSLAVGRLLLEEPPKDRKRGRADRTPSEVEKKFADADTRLRALAEASAGQAYFPASAAELDRIYADIGERLRNLYSLAYQPANKTLDGSFRRISVELVDEKGASLAPLDPAGNPTLFRVFARPGYFALREE